jgi:hypothetical protein
MPSPPPFLPAPFLYLPERIDAQPESLRAPQSPPHTPARAHRRSARKSLRPRPGPCPRRSARGTQCTPARARQTCGGGHVARARARQRWRGACGHIRPRAGYNHCTSQRQGKRGARGPMPCHTRGRVRAGHAVANDVAERERVWPAAKGATEATAHAHRQTQTHRKQTYTHF